MKDLILVTGSEGLVGSRFVEVSELKTSLHYPRQVELDITNPSEIKAVLSSYDFRAVVHFAAYTDVSEAEKQRADKKGDCWVVNVEGTRNLVEAVAPHEEKIHFVHISTDMVFPGSADDPGPYSEDHPAEKDPAKLTWYGYTKAEAERVVKRLLGDSATILRVIYPVRANFPDKLDYLRKPLRLYDAGGLYPLFSDQNISISFIDEVCKTIDKIIGLGARGVFHASSSNTATPFELISYMLEKTRGAKNVVKPINLAKFIKKTNASLLRYPQFGGLRVDATQDKLDIKFSTWREIVDKLVAQGLGE